MLKERYTISGSPCASSSQTKPGRVKRETSKWTRTISGRGVTTGDGESVRVLVEDEADLEEEEGLEAVRFDQRRTLRRIEVNAVIVERGKLGV